jgi:hypothetical protein
MIAGQASQASLDCNSKSGPNSGPCPSPGATSPVLFLGHLAAQCDLFATDPRTLPVERRDLERRAAAYRLQQMIEGDRAGGWEEAKEAAEESGRG